MISLVLVASVTLPVYAAAWTTLIPAEHISSVDYDGNIRKVTYDFGITPIVYYTTTGHSGNFYANNNFQIDGQTNFPFSFGVYPLGVYSEANRSLSDASSGRIAIDVSDFKSEAVISLSSHFHIEFDLGYRSEYPLYEDEIYDIVVSWSFMEYSNTGDYLGFLDGGTRTYNKGFQDMADYFVGVFELNHVSTLKLPSDNVGYIVPLVNVNISCSYDVDGIHPVNLRFAYDGFTITAGSDMLLKESLTLQAIEGKLDDLNEKTDIIINGSEQMQDEIDGMSNRVQDQDEEVGLVEEVEKEYLDAWAETNETYNNVILNFLKGRGWVQLGLLLKPILTWEHSVTIMVMVVAFVNLSVIFFGR